jgi:hypothetical protein
VWAWSILLAPGLAVLAIGLRPRRRSNTLHRRTTAPGPTVRLLLAALALRVHGRLSGDPLCGLPGALGAHTALSRAPAHDLATAGREGGPRRCLHALLVWQRRRGRALGIRDRQTGAAPASSSSTPVCRAPLRWAQLLKRIFRLDAPECPKCSKAVVVLALISDPPNPGDGGIHLQQIPRSGPGDVIAGSWWVNYAQKEPENSCARVNTRREGHGTVNAVVAKSSEVRFGAPA